MPNRSKAPQTQQPREIVRTMAAYGIPAEQIAMCMEMSAPTLRKHFRKELDTAKIQANAQVAGFLLEVTITRHAAAKTRLLRRRRALPSIQLLA